MGEGELAVPPRLLLAQHQDAGLRNGGPLKEEGRCQGNQWLQRSEKPSGCMQGLFLPCPAWLSSAGLASQCWEAWVEFRLCLFHVVKGQCDFLSSYSACQEGGRHCPSSHLCPQAAPPSSPHTALLASQQHLC